MRLLHMARFSFIMAELLPPAFFLMRKIETMETQAQPLRQNRLTLLLARPWASHLIATLGIVVMTVGLYVPIASRVLLGRGDSTFDDSWTMRDQVYIALMKAYLVMHGPLSLLSELAFVYTVLIWGGLALIPLLWRTLSPKGTVALRWTYAVWMALLMFLAIVGLPSLYQFMSQPPPRNVLPNPFTEVGPYLLPGAVVFPLGMLLCAAALILMLREPLPMPASPPAPRTDWQWAASIILTAGALAWGIGFYLMPEAVTRGCLPTIFSVTQLAHGACAGLGSDQMLEAAREAGLNPIAFLPYTLGRNYEFMVAAAGITTLGGWTRQISVKTLAWLAAWPVLALGTALVALQGVGVIAQHGYRLPPASISWHMAPGMVITFAGIGLVALGQAGLWRELVRRKGTASAQER